MALERVMSEVANLSCSPSATEIDLQWKDETSYSTAKSKWDWVNEESVRYIGMVVDLTACGGYRRPYKVSSFNTTESNYTMTMSAQPAE